jgi:hypothetical protein
VVSAYGKDWNEQWVWDDQLEKAPLPEREQTWKDLWRWHRVAQEVGRAIGYLQRITEGRRGGGVCHNLNQSQFNVG